MTGRMPELPDAACRQSGNLELFYAKKGGRSSVAAARQICARCWDRPECLAWGLEHEDSGMWGGHTRKGLLRLRQEFGISIDGLGAGWIAS